MKGVVMLAAVEPVQTHPSRRACGAGESGTRRPKGAWRLWTLKGTRALAGPRQPAVGDGGLSERV